jgi:hypothetical protein
MNPEGHAVGDDTLCRPIGSSRQGKGTQQRHLSGLMVEISHPEI